jgi:hypothetical protein
VLWRLDAVPRASRRDAQRAHTITLTLGDKSADKLPIDITSCR